MARIAHILGWYTGPGGYNVHTRSFADALSERMAVWRTDLPRRAGEVKPLASELETLRDEDELSNVLIAFGSFAHYMDGLPGRRIGYVVWETTKLPDSWRAPLERLDAWWVPCTWQRQVLIENGLDGARISVVPEGVDTGLFHAGVEPAETLSRRSGFKFLHVAKFEERKGTALLIKAFDEEFGARDDAHLILVCQNPFATGFDLAAEVRKLGIRSPGKFSFVHSVVDHEMMPSIYAAADAAVFPTRAEPWGLPITEAMASGLPTIVTNYGAPSDYASERTAFLLDYKLVDCPHFPVRMADGDFGQWAEPDADHLRHLMRWVYENREAAAERGKRAAEDMRNRWTWRHAAEAALTALSAGRS